jgi:phosphatidylserine/phosphatidylglycerophosphate/cardiolipin synthase-like enzyme
VSITINGRVVDEDGNGVGGVTVEARGDWLLTSEVLFESTSLAQTGNFSLVLKGIIGEPTHPAICRVRAVDAAGRPISDDKEVSAAAGDQSIGEITVRKADREGMLVTQRTGDARMVSDGNALKILIDGEEAFGHTADEISTAQKSVDMTQLYFGVPDFKDDQTKEFPQLIWKFGSKIAPGVPLPAGAKREDNPVQPPRTGDLRPELLALDVAQQRQVRVRILLNKPTISWPEGVFYLTVVSSIGAGLGVGATLGMAAFLGIGAAVFVAAAAVALAVVAVRKIIGVLDSNSHAEELRTYFERALDKRGVARRLVTVRPFEQPAPDNGVLHCKMVIVDDARAVVLGSPYSQRYFDGLRHEIDDPRRGDTTSDIVHDVSVAVVGPAVRDLHETFRLYWNEDQSPGNMITSIPQNAGPTVQTTGEDGVAKVQITRTLSAGRFKSLGGTSEKGILESYLRAFSVAERLIFLETQYFTDAIITDALKRVLKSNPALELILFVNIKPDVLLYPGRQARLINQLREAAPDQVAAFTRWSYDHLHPKPWVAPVYLHSKIGVVDDTWATIGSANLDGLSLDKNLLLSPLVFGETTAAELNVSIISSTVGTNGMRPAERLRRRLWAEHFGVQTNGALDPTHNFLEQTPGTKWVPFLKGLAEKARAHVAAGTAAPLPGFALEYTSAASEHDTPRRHLAALGVPLGLPGAIVRPIGRTRAFDFFTGRWKDPNREDFVGAGDMTRTNSS